MLCVEALLAQTMVCVFTATRVSSKSVSQSQLHKVHIIHRQVRQVRQVCSDSTMRVTTRVLLPLLLSAGIAVCWANLRGSFLYCMVLQGVCRTTCQEGETYYSADYLCAGSTVGTKCCSRVSTATRPATCGVGSSLASRIVHGQEALRCEFPWLVYINLSEGGSNRCGGSLIDDRHIITAAHCFSSVTNAAPEIVVGEYNRNETGRPREKFTTTEYRVIVHPAFNSQHLVNDLAIVRLTTPIDFSRFTCIQPICLPTSQNQVTPVNTQCKVAGWGQEGETSYDMPAVLKATNVSVLEDALCAARYNDYNSAIEMCAGDLRTSHDSCFGDSGGPLMCPEGLGPQMQLVGIISYGDGCGRLGTVAVYTQLSAFLPWIRDVVSRPL